MRDIIFPDDPGIRRVFAQGLDPDPQKAARTFRSRLQRAQQRGILPARLYVSPRIFGWDAQELEEALARLPRSHAAFTKPSD